MNPKWPPAVAAVAAFPHLHAQVARSLEAQARRIAERAAIFVPRPALLKTLDERVRAAHGGLLALEGPPGSGTTALLCHLAAARPCAFWLPEDDAGGGLEALCAQVLGLCDVPVKLVPPAAGRDATTLERLLAEAGAARAAGDPLVLLVDRPAGDDAVPLAPPFPAAIPPGVVVVLACTPGEPLPLPAAARVTMPGRGARLDRRLAQVATRLGCPPNVVASLVERSQGSFLYARFAAVLFQSDSFREDDLPEGLEALHQAWWNRLDQRERRLASLLAAAGEPVELALLADLAGVAASTGRAWLRRWRAFVELAERGVRLYHAETRAFVRAQSGDALAGAHAAYVARALARSGGQLERLREPEDGYLVRQVARHAALGDASARAESIPALATRGWAAARERATGTMRAAAHDMAWVLRAPSHQALPLVRCALLGGILTLLARVMPADAPAAALTAAMEAGSTRDAALRRVRAMVDQLPDGRDKALALRQLGEVCYALRMRASAMRMLSEALDLEAPGPSRAWRDEREETLVAFARAAIAIGHPDTALGITARIGHPERRGMVETEVVRWLLARGQLTRAEEVAYAIGHTAMHEWAMAEVAVGHAHTGDAARGETVLSTLKTETAIAWARGELACDAARAGDPHAAGRLAPIANSSLCDRQLAQLALALVAGGQPEAALEAACMVEDRVVRAQALIDLAQLQPPNASAALAEASAEIGQLTGDERAPLVASLAAAQATVDRLETALQTAALLAEDEERDRAQSRVAVALARRGAEADARIVADAIDDDDERDWALDELARLTATQESWEDAFALAAQIADSEQRARTEADLAIAGARAGEAAIAHAWIGRIEIVAERLRAYVASAPELVAQAGPDPALETIDRFDSPDQRSRYQAALGAALAAHGDLDGAQALASAVARPLDRARALAAIAQAAAAASLELAHQALAEALRCAAAQGRAETLKCLEWAADTLAALGGADLLLATASAIDEIDSWWV
jgi:hypothetical protein